MTPTRRSAAACLLAACLSVPSAATDLVTVTQPFPRICTEATPFHDPDHKPWHIITAEQVDPATYKCHWTDMRHPQVPVKPLQVCTHDPAVDTVISRFLHDAHFWGDPFDYRLLLVGGDNGPCSKERPYMLDIGANLGVFTIFGASRGCYALSFEPLSQNIQRLAQSLQAGGTFDRVKLFKHAVGKKFFDVSIGFRPSNPGASAIGAGGEVVEHMRAITIDGLLLGEHRVSFPTPPGGEPLPPIIGQNIGFAKIDTEGYDVAVVQGAVQTLLVGKVPLILIEFSPNDARGTAGCDPRHFVQLMYANGYRMYENGIAAKLKPLVDEEIPASLGGTGKRVFEAWFIHDDLAFKLMHSGVLQVEEI